MAKDKDNNIRPDRLALRRVLQPPWGRDEVPAAADPSARHEFEHAEAETCFLEHLAALRRVRLTSDPQLIVDNLESYLKTFLYQALCAYGDYLLDKQLPAMEADSAFDKYVSDLVSRTFNYKWLPSVRYFALAPEECLESRYASRIETVIDNVRGQFGALLWKGASDRALSVWEVPAQCDNGRESADQAAPPRKKPGPKTDFETALKVRAVVTSVVGDGPWSDKLDEICEMLDDKVDAEKIKCPKPWAKKGLSDWTDAATHRPDLARKAIEHHLNVATNSNSL